VHSFGLSARVPKKKKFFLKNISAKAVLIAIGSDNIKKLGSEQRPSHFFYDEHYLSYMGSAPLQCDFNIIHGFIYFSDKIAVICSIIYILGVGLWET